MLRNLCTVRLFLGSLIILVFPVMQQGIAQQNEESDGPRAEWQPPLPEKPKSAEEVKKPSDQPARVRIGLRMTPFKKIATRNKDGSLSQRFVPIEPIRHTLRSRLNKTNHFFLGEWHIETKPISWIKKTRKYQIKLTLHKRYGAFGQLEETVGSIDLAGTLDEGNDNVHVLLGVARQRIRDKFGHPILDVVAGFAPGTKANPVMSKNDHLSGRASSSEPAKAPSNYSGSLIRGRF